MRYTAVLLILFGGLGYSTASHAHANATFLFETCVNTVGEAQEATWQINMGLLAEARQTYRSIAFNVEVLREYGPEAAELELSDGDVGKYIGRLAECAEERKGCRSGADRSAFVSETDAIKDHFFALCRAFVTEEN